MGAKQPIGADWIAEYEQLLAAQDRLAVAEQRAARGEQPPPVQLRAEVERLRDSVERRLAFAMMRHVADRRARARP